MTRRRLARWAVAVLALCTLGLLGPGPLVTADPASAAALGGGVRLEITGLAPSAVRTNDVLRVTGTVTNNGARPVRLLAVRLRLSGSRLNSRSELAAVLGDTVSAKDGEVLGQTALPDLAPGASGSFELSGPVAGVDSATGFGVYLLGIEAVGTRTASGTTAGRLVLQRTAVPRLPDVPDYSPTGYSWLWPLVSAPVRLADGTFADDSLAADLAPTGRLARLLDAGGRLQPGSALTWAIDPDLVETVAAMAAPTGYRVRTPGGGTTPGAGGAAAIAWLAGLQTLATDHDVLVLPYADPDLAALVRDHRQVDLTTARASGLSVLQAQLPGALLLPDIAWPNAGYADRATLSALADHGVTAAVLDGRSLPASIDLSYTPSARAATNRLGRLSPLLADPGLTDLLSTAAAARFADPVLLAQRIIAETAMITSELPGTGTGRTILAMPPRRWAPSQAFLDELVAAMPTAPWMAPVTLPELAAAPLPQIDRGRLRYPGAQRETELPLAYLRALDSFDTSVSTFGQILTDRTKFVPGLNASLLRLESSWWRGRDARAIRLDREQTYLRDLRGSVRVQPGSFTFGSSSGTIPLTLVNELPQEVHVGLNLQALTPQLRLRPVKVPPLGPKQKVQVEVRASAVAGGRVVVQAGLETPGGTPYGQPVQLPVEVTQIGAFALIITVSAAVVLFLAAGYRITRRIRAAARAEAEADPSTEPDSPTVPDSPTEPDS